MSKTSWIAILATACFTIPASAKVVVMKSDHRQLGDEKMAGGQRHETDPGATNRSQPLAGGTQVRGVGVINSVNADKGTINITHEPIPEIDWPTMTMDLAVTKSIDLSGMDAGDKVNFKLKLGRDKQYRITDMEAVE